MKVKLLLCMMLLGLLTATAQPRVTQDEYRQLPNPHGTIVQTLPADNAARDGVATTPKRANKAHAGEIEHQVDFVLDFDTECQKANEIWLVNQNHEISNYDQGIFVLEKGTTTLTVPDGTYEIFVHFSQVDMAQESSVLHELRVIREQVTINQDMQLNFAANEAKNHIHFETLTPDGEPVNMGKWAVDDDYINWTELEPANTHYFQYLKNIYCSDYGWMFMTRGTLDVTIVEGPHYSTGHEYSGDFFVNDVSNRYTFYTYQVGYRDHEFFTTAYEVQGASDDVTITNDPGNYVLFQDPMTAQKHQDEELYPSFIFYNQLQYEKNNKITLNSATL